MKTGEKHKTVQNTSPIAKLIDPMMEPSQERACNNIIQTSKTPFSSSTSTDYVFISEGFNITTCDQTRTNQPTTSHLLQKYLQKDEEVRSDKISLKAINTDSRLLGLLRGSMKKFTGGSALNILQLIFKLGGSFVDFHVLHNME